MPAFVSISFAEARAAKSDGLFRKPPPKHSAILPFNELSPSSSRSESQRLFIFPPASLFTSGSTSATAFSISSGYLTLKGEALCEPISPSRVSSSLAVLFFLRAVIPVTGTPSRSDSSLRLILIFLRFASSIRLTHTAVSGVISSICSTRFKFLSRQVASQTTATASGEPKQMKSRATSSSAECAIREYVPGISTSI